MGRDVNMEQKKYVLTDEKKEWCGRTLRRIRALRDFRDVKAGELGGWVETEKNLTQMGDAWVYDDAQVSGDARVSGDASIIWIGNIWCKILNLEKAAPAVGIKVGASSRILIQGPSFVRGSFHTAHANPQKESLLTTISTHVNSISQQWIGFLCGARFSNLTRAGLQNVRFAAKVRNAGGISASRTADNMRRFDGSYQFDGSRKWNAKIERSDL